MPFPPPFFFCKHLFICILLPFFPVSMLMRYDMRHFSQHPDPEFFFALCVRTDFFALFAMECTLRNDSARLPRMRTPRHLVPCAPLPFNGRRSVSVFPPGGRTRESGLSLPRPGEIGICVRPPVISPHSHSAWIEFYGPARSFGIRPLLSRCRLCWFHPAPYV